ncbi:MAG: MFS transporter [Chloroflexota bacterium]
MPLSFTVNNRFRLFFGLQFAGIAIFYPYIALYLISLGLSSSQIGLLLALVPLLGFVVQPLWGIATDIHHQHRLILVLACLSVGIVLIIYAFAQTFWLLLLLTVLIAVMRAPIQILVTALALEHLARQQTNVGFGSLRLWGSVGFVVASLGFGAVFIDAENTWWIIPFYALCKFLLAIVAYTLPNADVHGQVSWREGVQLLQRNRTLAWFLFGLLLIGMTLGVVNNYLAVYLVDIEGASWMIGTALALSAVFEIPLLARTQSFINRWGIRLMLLVGTAVLPLRWLLFAFIDEPLWVLPIQLSHSIAMMSLLVVAVLYVDRLLEPKWRTSGQALYTAFLHSVGPGIGLFFAGYIYGWNGIQFVWLFSAAVALLGLGVLVYAMYWRPKRD